MDLPSTLRQDWMDAAGTRQVLAALTAEGQEVRFVGGCVRDGLLDLPVQDIDLATPDTPDLVLELLAAAKIKAIATGISHGTITAIADDQVFEVTTLRRDVETDGRWAQVAFTDDWQEDAARRDFTINALSANPDGKIFDYFDGLADLSAGRVRFVGDAAARIDEDFLRILRFYRFAARYGKGPLDLAARRACQAAAAGLQKLSAERIASEWLKLLAAPHPVPVLRLIRDDGVLAPIIAPPLAIDRLDDLRAIDPSATDPLLRFGVLLLGADGVTSAAIKTLARKLKLSNRAIRRLEQMAILWAGHRDPDASDGRLPGLDDGRGWRAFAYRHGKALAADMMMVVGALDRLPPADVRAALRALADWTPPVLPISGKDAKAFGQAEGPQVGAALRAAEDWWIAGDFDADRAGLLDKLSAFLADQ